MLDDSVNIPLTTPAFPIRALKFVGNIILQSAGVLHLSFSSIQVKFNYITHLIPNLHKFSSHLKCRRPSHVCWPSFAWSCEANVVPVTMTRITESSKLHAMIMENMYSYNFPLYHYFKSCLDCHSFSSMV